MQIYESFVLGKRKDQDFCEDIIVYNDNFILLIDGATDTSGFKYNNLNSGKFAAQCIASCIDHLDKDINIYSFVDNISKVLREKITLLNPNLDLKQKCRPCASIVAYSNYKKQVWRIGDCHWGSIKNNIFEFNTAEKQVDKTISEIRSFLLTQAIARGYDESFLLEEDISKSFVSDLINKQFTFQNLDIDNKYSYGLIDGEYVPRRFCEIFDVSDKDQIILASDGYPLIFENLSKTEKYLQNYLLEDPLFIYKHKNTKGLCKDNNSFDDRSYIRFSI